MVNRVHDSHTYDSIFEFNRYVCTHLIESKTNYCFAIIKLVRRGQTQQLTYDM